MKLKSHITACLLTAAALTFSCSGDDGGTETPTGEFSLSSFTLSDIENMGNGSDIALAFTVSSDLSVLKEVRFIISEAALTQAEATQLSGNQYTVVDATIDGNISLSAGLSTSSGNLVTEDMAYQAYLLGVFDNSEIPSILSPATPFTLKNETLVTTMELSGTFDGMEDVALAADGTLYVNGGGNSPSNLFKITTDGVSSILSTDMDNAVGIAIDPSGNIISSSFNSTTIYSTTPAGVTTPLVTDSRLAGGGGLVFDNQGNLYNAFFAQDVLYQIQNGVVTEFASSSDFNGPIGIAYDKTRGDIYVSSFNSGSIYQVVADGTVTLIGDTPASIGHMSFANDHFYISGWNQHKVYKVSLSGEVIETIGRGSNGTLDGPAATARFSQPNGIEATADGRYVYVSQGDGQLRKLIMARDN